MFAIGIQTYVSLCCHSTHILTGQGEEEWCVRKDSETEVTKEEWERYTTEAMQLNQLLRYYFVTFHFLLLESW